LDKFKNSNLIFFFKKSKKRICNRIFPFQNTSHKIAKIGYKKTKQNKSNQSHCNGQSILRYHVCFLVVTFLKEKDEIFQGNQEKKKKKKPQ
jgi:hypothetical protein